MLFLKNIGTHRNMHDLNDYSALIGQLLQDVAVKIEFGGSSLT